MKRDENSLMFGKYELSIKIIIWNIYRTVVVLFVGYLSVILGIFTTDDPRGTGVVGGIVFAILLFAIFYALLVIFPYKIYRFVSNKKDINR